MSSNNSSNCNSNSTNYKIGIVLFRCHDLRIVDQPALYHAVEGGNCENVIPLFLTSSACSGYHVPRAVDTTSTTTTTTTVSSSSSFVSGPTSLSSDSESTGAFDYAYGSDYHQRANAAEVWITEALHALNRSLADRGKGLTVRSCGRGTPTEVAAAVLRIVGDLHQLDSTITAKTAVLFANTRFEPNARSHDEELVRLLSAARIAVHFHNASLLYDPRDIRLCSGVEGKWRGHWGTLMPFVGACRSLGKCRNWLFIYVPRTL